MHIFYAELPKALIFTPPAPPSTKKKQDNKDRKESSTEQQPMKRTATEIHSMLKRKCVDVIAKAATSATLTDICKLCNTKPVQLTSGSNICKANFLGKCVSSCYTHQHRVATDAEAGHIPKLLEHANNPELLHIQGWS
eukprot:120422-Ditylum_brightwellii.AAC.1